MFFINEEAIYESLNRPGPDGREISDIIDKASSINGLTFKESAALLACSDPESLLALYGAAARVKERVYGRRVVLFAPLYMTNRCVNNCLYCGFRKENGGLVRRTLRREEVVEEARILAGQGHKRVLLVCGEHPDAASVDKVCSLVADIYSAKEGKGAVRRVNVNMAPPDVGGFKALREAKIGTFQAFQETYSFEAYSRMHPEGPKADYQWRLFAMDRAMSGGVDDVGMGVLFGLHDARFEALALLQHVGHLEERFGVGCHTLSVPRLEPALNAPAANSPPHAVTDAEFKKIVAVLRLSLPYAGIILSTREMAGFRRELLDVGVSQISAGSRTFPGAYRARLAENREEEQFHVGDGRSLDEVVQSLAADGFIPSFCTACYRSGRTGEKFMELAKPGEIHSFCDPNALVTAAEYAADHASEPTARAVWSLLEGVLDDMHGGCSEKVRDLLDRVRGGERDLFF